MAALKDSIDIDDDNSARGSASDANTAIYKTDNEAENTDAEKTDVETDNNSGNAAAVLPEDSLSADDYPKGLQFFFILLALILSIFMVALDLVCFYLPIYLTSDI
jgi:hypothetical protein